MRLKTRLATLRSSARALWKDTGGQSLMIFGLMAVPLCGAVGIGLDVAQWTVWKRQLHSAADAAALAGATAKLEGKNVKAAVNKALSHNTQRAYTVTAIEDTPTAGAYKNDSSAVRVILSTSQKLSFSSMFQKTTPTLTATATAISRTEVSNCVIALDAAGTALEIGGSAAVDFNCGMASNSNLAASSSDNVKAGALSAVGTITTGSKLDPDTKLNEGIVSVADPLKGKLPAPTPPVTCNGYYTQKSNTVGTIPAGCYAGLSVKGNLTLSPGTYWFDGGSVDIGAGARINGTGVTLIFSNSDTSASAYIGKFTATGNSIVRLSAPSTGTYAGILMHRDERAGATDAMLLTGTSGTETGGGTLKSYYEGTVYAPSSMVEFTGNSSIDTPCMQIVSFRVKFWGNTSVTNSCPAGKGAVSNGGTVVLRLVE